MLLSRRSALRGISASLAISNLPGCAPGDEAEDVTARLTMRKADPTVFAHGVASGDPTADRVILWTRLSKVPMLTTSVSWAVANDPEFRNVVAMGEATASFTRDYTVKVDVTDLAPATTYYYVFFTNLARSSFGRTRTLPSGGVEHARLAVTSCSNYGWGYFHAYRNIAARKDLDLWVHLGDYIYEYGEDTDYDSSLDRGLEPRTEVLTLKDYRMRYAHYRGDPDLQEIHRQHPMIAIWDDHEIANDANAHGALNHTEGKEGTYSDRKRAATRAFVEWMPIRVADEDAELPRIYRSFRFGDLFDLIMLDTRLIGRDAQAGIGTGKQGNLSQWKDPSRTLLGHEQESWLISALARSRDSNSTWRLIGNQVIFSPVLDPTTGSIFRADMWDGYRVSRRNVIEHLEQEGIDNVVFLSGDAHTSWALEVTEDPYSFASYDPETSRGACAVEFVTPATTSSAFESQKDADYRAEAFRIANPHLKWHEITRKGYTLVDITHERIQAEWYFVEDIKHAEGRKETLAAAFQCGSGAAHLEETKAESLAKRDAPALAPTDFGWEIGHGRDEP